VPLVDPPEDALMRAVEALLGDARATVAALWPAGMLGPVLRLAHAVCMPEALRYDAMERRMGPMPAADLVSMRRLLRALDRRLYWINAAESALGGVCGRGGRGGAAAEFRVLARMVSDLEDAMHKDLDTNCMRGEFEARRHG
jgi:hypothetical protein